MKKRAYQGSPPNFGWRNHKESPIGTPSKEEAMEGFNTFIGWCIGQGLKDGDYSNFALWFSIRKYISLLNSFYRK